MIKDQSHSEKGYPVPPQHGLAARNLLHEPSYSQDNTYHSIYYTSCAVLAKTRNDSMSQS